ncbi:hypothetical protein LOK49_LG10G01361 [Camellia lanceoleosa]|uniref:Uncharacterized protein n=1 Tax=Camellia lanceoleosa TaxID=1840588 RepID=A0ACC0G912_9ERIC|nr:hypothetical protein LOK49_LG10G01361 [Camellia lanceoleosa]
MKLHQYQSRHQPTSLASVGKLNQGIISYNSLHHTAMQRMNYNRNLRVSHYSTDLDDTMDIIHTVHPPNRFEGRQTQNQSSTNLATSTAPASQSPSDAEHFSRAGQTG